MVEMDNKKEKEEKDRVTISITPELHSALILAALEHGTSISQIIEDALRDAKYAKEIRSIYLPKAIEYNKEEIELSAASPHSLKQLRREEPEKKKV